MSAAVLSLLEDAASNVQQRPSDDIGRARLCCWCKHDTTACCYSAAVANTLAGAVPAERDVLAQFQQLWEATQAGQGCIQQQLPQLYRTVSSLCLSCK
jgi:hypothetical protein